MKLTTLLSVVFCLFANQLLYSQCDIGTVRINNQAELEDFANQYNGCDQLSGRLEIRTEVTSLLPLSFLKEFRGDLWLASLNNLSSLNGLNALEKIRDGELRIIGNLGFSDFTGLNNLNEVEGNLYIGTNAEITSFAGFENLTRVGGDFHLSYLENINQLNGFEDLMTIGANLTLQGMSIDNLLPLSNLRTINGDLFLSGAGIGSLKGLEQIQRIGGSIRMNGTAMDDFTGLENLHSVGAIEINAGNGLKNFRGLHSLDTVYGNFVLSRCDFVDSIVGIENLRYIGGGMDLQQCDRLKDLSGFCSLNRVEGNIQIFQLDSLTSLYGLGALKYTTRMNVSQNDLLTQCNIQSVCNFIEDQNVSVSFFANGPFGGGCSNASDISSHCGSTVDGFDFYSQQDLDDFKVQHPQVTKIVGTVNIEGNDIVDLSALNNVRSIGGPLRIHRNPQLETLAGLNNLSRVGRQLTIYTNDELRHLDDLSELAEIDRYVEISFSPKLVSINNLSNLNEINGSLFLKQLDNLTDLTPLRNISQIKGRLMIFDLETITSLDGLQAIDSIGNDLLIKDCDLLTDLSALDPVYINEGIRIEDMKALKRIDGFNNLPRIGKTLEISDNPLLEEVSGFEGLEEIDQHLRFYNNDTLREVSGFNQLHHLRSINFLGGPDNAQITGLGNLETVSFSIYFNSTGFKELPDFSRIDSCYRLDIENNDRLLELPDFSNLDVVHYLQIEDNDSLQNLNALSSLRDILLDLKVINNASLESLEGLMPLEKIGNNLIITDNEQLSMCEINAVCGLLNLTPEKALIANNQVGCEDKADLDCSLYGFSGRTFFDLNRNKQKDEDELYIPGVQVLNATIMETVFTNSEGKWYYPVDDNNTYQFDFDTSQEEWTLSYDTASYVRAFTPGAPSNLNLDFGVFPKEPAHKATIHISSALPRCRTIVPFYVEVRNSGAYIDSFLIELNYNEFIQLDSTDTALIIRDTTNRQLSWQTPALSPYESQLYTFWMQVANEDFIGEYIHLSGAGTVDSAGVTTAVAETGFSIELRCSYDPNDKLVNPVPRPEDSLSLKDETLTYTVRFQNTGNLEAIDVLITDTLDTNLDWGTFEVLSATHRVFTSLSDDGIVRFNFENIYLPDSLSDPEGSQGQVVYQIRPIEGLIDYSTIQNTAYIYFDGNSPIITNTTYNILVDEFPVTSTTEARVLPFKLLPNPATDYLQIETSGQIEAVKIFNAEGKCLQKVTTPNAKIDVAHLRAGYYLLSIQQDGHLYHVPFVKM